MSRPSRSFTVEIRGRRKPAPLSWADLISKEVTASPIGEEKNSQSSPPNNATIDAEKPSKGRILPSLVPEFGSVSVCSDTPSKPVKTRKKREPRLPKATGQKDSTFLATDMTPAAISAPAPENKQRDEDRVAPSPWRRRRPPKATYLARSEKWKRRFPAILR